MLPWPLSRPKALTGNPVFVQQSFPATVRAGDVNFQTAKPLLAYLK